MIPSDLASFVVCHEARDHVGSDNDPISQLIGKYGSPNGQVQATAGMRPLLKLAGTGGYQCLRFDNTDDELLFDAATALAGPLTIFHVYAGLGNQSGLHKVLAGDPAYNGGWGQYWYLDWQGAGPPGWYQSEAYPGGGNEANYLDYRQDEVRVHCLKHGVAFTTTYYYVDNGLKATSAAATGPGTLHLGLSGAPANMDWLATIGFNAELSDSDRNGIHNYIVQEILGGGMQMYPQAYMEALMTGASNMRYGQTCIEYIRSVETLQGQRFWGQVIES